MKEKILELLKEKDLSILEIEKKLKVKGQSAFASLMKTLNQLEDEKKIEFTQENRYRLLNNDQYTQTGILSVNRAGNGFIDGASESTFIGYEDLNGALDGDEVAIKLTDSQPGHLKGIVTKIIKHSHTQVVGNVSLKDDRLVFIPDDKTISPEIKITNFKDFPKIAGSKAIATITDFHYPFQGKIKQLIGPVCKPGVDVEGILSQHNIFAKFPEAVTKECSLLPKEVTKEELVGRKDLSSYSFVTIDGDDAKDFDDAVYLEKQNENYLLSVSIADVSHYVKENSPLDKEAYNRGTSVYVVDRVVPMLPNALSENLCSLMPNQIRLTQTCEMRVNNEGKVTSYKIYPSYIRSHYRLTYNEVNAVLNKDNATLHHYRDIVEMLEGMAELSALIRQQRYDAGAIDFETTESEIKVNKKGEVISIEPRVRDKAEKLIEDFMILANNCVAREMDSKQYPSIYRVHDRPSLKKLTEFKDLCTNLHYPFKVDYDTVTSTQFQQLLSQVKDQPEYAVLSRIMLRTMAKAKYEPECKPHFGLALDKYLHFTSPIRRYPDLIVSRMLRKYLYEKDNSSKDLENDFAVMEQISVHASDRERNANDAEYAVDALKMAQYMENHLGDIYEGIITSVTGFGLFVSLPNTVEGLVKMAALSDDYYVYDQTNYTLIGQHRHRIFTIGQGVQVQCVSASPSEHSVGFIILGLKDDHRNKKSHRPSKRPLKSNNFKSKTTTRKRVVKHGKNQRKTNFRKS